MSETDEQLVTLNISSEIIWTVVMSVSRMTSYCSTLHLDDSETPVISWGPNKVRLRSSLTRRLSTSNAQDGRVLDIAYFGYNKSDTIKQTVTFT